jgi:membrane associated rhomboid family serine protease
MTPTSVGMRCPECARERTRVRRLPRRQPGVSVSWSNSIQEWSVTQWLIAVNVVVFLAEVATGVPLFGSGRYGGWVYIHGVLFGPNIAGFGRHEYWRLLTTGFLHASLIHIGLNMLSLWFVGRALEPAVGRLNFAVIYFTSLLAGSFGALLFEPRVPTLGASTAIFGVFGALIVVAHARRIPIWQSGLVPILLFNLVFTLTISGISVGGHLGGLAAGFITGWLVVEFGEKRDQEWLALTGCLLVAVVSVGAAIAVAGGTGLTPNGLTL